MDWENRRNERRDAIYCVEREDIEPLTPGAPLSARESAVDCYRKVRAGKTV